MSSNAASDEYLYVCSYDWSDYGHGVDAVFTSEKAAEKWTYDDPSWDGWRVRCVIGGTDNPMVFTDEYEHNYRYITRVRKEAEDA